MMLALALLEALAIFAVLFGAILAWDRPPAGDLLPGTLGPALAFGLGATLALYYGDAYDPRTAPTVGRFLERLPRCLLLTSIPLAASFLVFREARPAVLTTALVMPALLIGLRALFCGCVRGRRFAKRVLIVGTGPLAHRAVEAVESQGGGRYVIAGVAGDAEDMDEGLADYPHLGPLTNLEQIIESSAPDRIVVALEERRRRMPVPPLLEARLRGIVVEDGAELYERLTGKLAIEALTPSSLIFCRDFRPAPVALAAGRAMSVGAAAVGLVVFAPLFALIALVIRLDSPGPIFFVQQRVGWRGRRFPLVKFRTMFETSGPRSEWARDNDHRITRVGRWLRRFRLDELPQFVNILRGDMDLVGPRPHPATNFSLFVTVLRNSPECGEQIPYYSLRSMVRPGMTGWAQVRYRYANTLEEEIEKMRYDLFYVKHRSLWLDIRILADTVRTVLGGHDVEDADARRGPAASPRTGAERAGARRPDVDLRRPISAIAPRAEAMARASRAGSRTRR